MNHSNSSSLIVPVPQYKNKRSSNGKSDSYSKNPMSKGSIHGNLEPAKMLPLGFSKNTMNSINNSGQFTSFMNLPNHGIPFGFPMQSVPGTSESRNQNININITINNLNTIPTSKHRQPFFPKSFKTDAPSTRNIHIIKDQEKKVSKHFSDKCDEDKHLKILGHDNEVLVLCNDYPISENEKIVKNAQIFNEKTEANEANLITEEVHNFLNSDIETIKKKDELMNSIVTCCEECKCYLFKKGEDPGGCCATDLRPQIKNKKRRNLLL